MTQPASAAELHGRVCDDVTETMGATAE